MSMESANQEVWIGVDVGTTGVRAIAYTADGTNVCSAEAFYPLLTPHPDWAEENPLQIYESVEQVIRQTADQLRYKNKELCGVALSTVMHSFAGLNADKEPLMDMQTWADSRSVDIVKEMKKDPDLCRSFYERTGCPIHASYPFTKIIWLHRHQPDLFKQMKFVGSIKDYMFYKMTDQWVIDKSTASTSGMYNEQTLAWDEDILAYAGIDISYMPPVVSTTYSHPLSASAAAAMTTAAEDATSKGIKCGGNLTMSGGSCTIDSTDHAVHAAGTAVFSGTTLEITSDNKGISSHGDLEISGGDITIHSCTEGVESKAEMTISGGNVRILDASDDGLNTGGSDSGSYAMTITGGTLLALSSKGMMEYPESGCLIATNCNAAAGEQISIVDKNGTVLATLQSPKAVSDVIYGIGDSDSADYTIVTGGTYDGTLNEDGYGEGGSVSGGTEVTANGGTGSMNGGAPAGGGQGGTPPEMPNLNNSGGNTAS